MLEIHTIHIYNIEAPFFGGEGKNAVENKFKPRLLFGR
jgi:hypothetical protein